MDDRRRVKNSTKQVLLVDFKIARASNVLSGIFSPACVFGTKTTDPNFMLWVARAGEPFDQRSCTTYSLFNCSQVFGCHSLANRWASDICETGIFLAIRSLCRLYFFASSGVAPAAARLIHLWAFT